MVDDERDGAEDREARPSVKEEEPADRPEVGSAKPGDYPEPAAGEKAPDA